MRVKIENQRIKTERPQRVIWVVLDHLSWSHLGIHYFKDALQSQPSIFHPQECLGNLWNYSKKGLHIDSSVFWESFFNFKKGKKKNKELYYLITPSSEKPLHNFVQNNWQYLKNIEEIEKIKNKKYFLIVHIKNKGVKDFSSYLKKIKKWISKNKKTLLIVSGLGPSAVVYDKTLGRVVEKPKEYNLSLPLVVRGSAQELFCKNLNLYYLHFFLHEILKK